jgi:hypothetical protein
MMRVTAKYAKLAKRVEELEARLPARGQAPQDAKSIVPDGADALRGARGRGAPRALSAGSQWR